MEAPSTFNPPAPQDARLHFLDYWRIIRVRKTVIIAFFLLVVMTTTMVTYFLPKTYSSMARIEVEKDQPDVETLQVRQMVQSFDPFFIQTQFEIIQSKTILYKVIEKLDLANKWAKRRSMDRLKMEQAFALLKRNMRLSQTRNTSLIEITVFVEGEENKQEAADIANTVAEVYKEYRMQTRTDMTQKGVKALQDKLDEQEINVSNKQAVVEQFRKDLDVMEIDPMTGRSSGSLDDETLRRLEAQRIELEADYIHYAKLYNRLTNMSPSELRLSLNAAKPDEVLTTLMQDLNQAEQKRAVLGPDLLPDHPDVQKVAKMLETVNIQITNQIQGILKGLKATVDSYEGRFLAVDTKVKEAREKSKRNAEKWRPFVAAKEDLDLAKQLKNALSLRVSTEEVNLKVPYSIVKIVDPAEASDKHVRPSEVLNITLGVILGLVLGIGLAFFIEYLDTSVKTIDDVERALQAPVLAVIPQNVGSLLDEGPESTHAEAYRVLRTNLLFSRKDESHNTVTVVSAGAGEGKSTTLFNLAVIFSQNGHRVLLVDSDLRRPSLHKILRVSNAIGLTNYLLRQNTLEEVIQTTPSPTLDFLPSGKLPSSSMGILSSVQMREMTTELKKRYDFIFFDAPPIMGVSDASVLASMMDITLQVIQYRRYPQPMTIRAKQMIEKVGGNLAGIVLNNITMTSDASYYYYYGGYYTDHYSKVDDEQMDRTSKKVEKGKAQEKKEPEIKQKY